VTKRAADATSPDQRRPTRSLVVCSRRVAGVAGHDRIEQRRSAARSSGRAAVPSPRPDASGPQAKVSGLGDPKSSVGRALDPGRRCLGGLPFAISISVPGPLDGKPGRSPGLESALEVGSAGEAEIVQRRGRQARLIALVANEDDATIEIAPERRVAAPGSRIDPPLEHVAGAHTRAGDQSVALSLTVGTDVDEHRSLTRRAKGVPGRNPIEPPAGCRDEVVDSGAAGVRQAASLPAPRGSAASGRCRHPRTERGST
jgi:hypothetical protein